MPYKDKDNQVNIQAVCRHLDVGRYDLIRIATKVARLEKIRKPSRSFHPVLQRLNTTLILSDKRQFGMVFYRQIHIGVILVRAATKRPLARCTRIIIDSRSTLTFLRTM